MSTQPHAVVGIGNAIVDVTSQESQAFIADNGLVAGAMTLVDAERSDELYRAMGPASETSGGSAANTIAGLASFGSRVGFIGKVRDDQLGDVFRHDIRAAGVDFDVPSATDGPPTARCLIVVTPDAARTMNTFLGISSLLHPDDIDVEMVGRARVLFCEGYIWDVPITKQAIRRAIEATRSRGNKVSFTLSDSFCVERHHEEWLEMVDNEIDVLFANEAEICRLYETDDVWEAIDAVRGRFELVHVTRSAKGSVVVTRDQLTEVPAEAVDAVVDTTGAGDLFAAGALYGYVTGLDPVRSARLGSTAAAEVISHLGARPLRRLTELAPGPGPLS